jgi:hypothetical protein
MNVPERIIVSSRAFLCPRAQHPPATTTSGSPLRRSAGSKLAGAARLGGSMVAGWLALSALAGTPAGAAYVLNLTETETGVVGQGSGSINLSGLTKTSEGTLPGAVRALAGLVIIGAQAEADQYSGQISGPSGFGAGDLISLATTGSGFIIGVFGSANTPNGATFFSPSDIILPNDYISGADLGVSTAEWTGASFASLGINPGTYIWQWDTGSGTDSFTLNTVPVPGPLPVLGAGIAFGWSRKIRRRLTSRSRPATILSGSHTSACLGAPLQGGPIPAAAQPGRADDQPAGGRHSWLIRAAPFSSWS